MKLKNLLAMTAIALLTASCSDDDNNENESINPAVNIAGTYAGYSEAAFQYTDTPLVSADESLTIQTDADNTTATITYTSSSFGEFTISGTVSEYPCTVTGSIDANKENVSFTFTVPGVMGGLTITFTQGEAPAANE